MYSRPGASTIGASAKVSGAPGTGSTSAWAACQAERRAAISLGEWPSSAAGAGSGEAESAEAATAFAATGAAA